VGPPWLALVDTLPQLQLLLAAQRRRGRRLHLGLTAIRVYNPDGCGKLKGGDWVDFRVTIRAGQPGTYNWPGEVDQSNDCSGAAFLKPISLTMTVLSPAPTPPPRDAGPDATVARDAGPDARPDAAANTLTIPRSVAPAPWTPAPAQSSSPRAGSPPAIPASTGSPPPSRPAPTATSSRGPSSSEASVAESDAPIPPASPFANLGSGEDGGAGRLGRPSYDEGYLMPQAPARDRCRHRRSRKRRSAPAVTATRRWRWERRRCPRPTSTPARRR
jgi:hypothetical protein